jgi:tryptophan synthase alpha chain
MEIGVPYSDPGMDGPVIQQAVDVAVRAGVGMRDVLRAVEAVAEAGAVPVVMTYWNPVERYGVERFATDLAAAGGAGAITPDLIPDEAGAWIAASAAADLDRVFLVAPSSTDARLRSTTEACRGFVYAASTMGVTGARTSVGAAAEGLVRRVRAVTPLPVCVGLGVSTAAQAAEVAAFADGVIVGSALVARLLTADDAPGGARAVAELAAELAAGVRVPRGR